MGKKAKPIPETPEQTALMRAQLLALEKQDTEINERKRRILRGQYSTFAGALKSGATKGIPLASTTASRPTAPSIGTSL